MTTAVQVAAVVGAGLVGGVYATFSIMVMPALRHCDDRTAAAAMIAVNRAAERGPFIVVFGTAALAALGLAGTALPRGTAVDLGIAAASLGSSMITVAVNVPLNRRLARDGADYWPAYSRRWGRANTARALLAALAVSLAGLQWTGITAR